MKEKLNNVLKKEFYVDVDIFIQCPEIVIPFKPDNNINNECWVFNMGRFSSKTFKYTQQL